MAPIRIALNGGARRKYLRISCVLEKLMMTMALVIQWTGRHMIRHGREVLDRCFSTNHLASD